MEIQYKTKLKEGDIVTRFGVAFVAMKRTTRRCVKECDMFDTTRNRCNGFCFRWDNPDDIVFKLKCDESRLPFDSTIVQTMTSKLMAEK